MLCSVLVFFYYNLSQYGAYLAVMQVSGISLSDKVQCWSYIVLRMFISYPYIFRVLLLHHLLNKTSPPHFHCAITLNFAQGFMNIFLYLAFSFSDLFRYPLEFTHNTLSLICSHYALTFSVLLYCPQYTCIMRIQARAE